MRRIPLNGSLDLSSTRAGSGTSIVENLRIDDEGANVPRLPIEARTLTGINSGTTVIGMAVYGTDLIVVGSDRWIYRITSGTPTVATPLSTSDPLTQLGGTGVPVFARDPSDLFIVGGGRITRVTAGAPTASRFTTGPENATHVASIGQRLIANDRANATKRQQYFWSDLGDGNDSTWNALSFATAEARPDEVVAVYENTSEVFIFGTETLQVYSVGVDPLNPFDLVNTVNVGLGAIYSPIRSDNAFAFIDETGRVVMSDGHSSRVTDLGAPIVKEIRTFNYSTAIGWRERVDSWDLLCWTFPDNHRLFELDLKRKHWGERRAIDSRSGLQYSSAGLQYEFPAACYASWNGDHVYGRNDTNGLAQIADAHGLELGSKPVLCIRQTGYQSFGAPDAKRSRRVRFVLRRPEGAYTGVNGTFEARVQDDGRPWSKWRSCTVGSGDDVRQTVDFYFGGVFNRRRYEFHYAGTPSTEILEAYDDFTVLGGF